MKNTTRDRIIDATCTLLEMQGYHATGLNQIISESGAPKGSLYHYFPGGKEELVTQAIRQSGELINMRIRGSLAEIPDPVQAICAFLRTLSFYVERSEFSTGGPVTTVALEMASTNDALRQVCLEVYTGWQAIFAEKLCEGGFAPDRADRLATVIIAMIEGAIVLCRTQQDAAPLLAAADELELLLQTASTG